MKGRVKDPSEYEDAPNPNRKDRKCLFCKCMFPSTGPAHRICRDCKGKKSYQSNIIPEVRLIKGRKSGHGNSYED
jgi:hypothetical protein